MKFIVKLIQVPDIGQAEVHEFAVQSPSHVMAIQQAIEKIGDKHLPVDLRSVAYVAEKVDRRPEDEPEEIFFMRRPLTMGGWVAIEGEDVRDATPEETADLAAAGLESGIYGRKNEKFRELPKRKKR